jgi:hypothetical protein
MCMCVCVCLKETREERPAVPVLLVMKSEDCNVADEGEET